MEARNFPQGSEIIWPLSLSLRQANFPPDGSQTFDYKAVTGSTHSQGNQTGLEGNLFSEGVFESREGPVAGF